jgi:hypothetical protein
MVLLVSVARFGPLDVPLEHDPGRETFFHFIEIIPAAARKLHGNNGFLIQRNASMA